MYLLVLDCRDTVVDYGESTETQQYQNLTMRSLFHSTFTAPPSNLCSDASCCTGPKKGKRGPTSLRTLRARVNLN